jgi:dihydrofolate reductase
MARVRVHCFAVSLDGYGAGVNQSADDPLGVDGMSLHQWVLPTRTFCQQLLGLDGGETGLDDSFVARGFEGIGATIMGRNMFGPVRGSWPDESWVGWWGDNPPFHHPVFVLTHNPRPPLVMDGGTTFHFVTDGIEAGLARATEAAGELDIRLGGGVATIQQYLRSGLIDELHLAVVPVLLGSGERLFDRPTGGTGGYKVAEFTPSATVAHTKLVRSSEPSSGGLAAGDGGPQPQPESEKPS